MKDENTFISNDGRTTVHYIKWYPNNNIKGVIQLTHGMTEYMGNYENFADFLCNNGFLVIGHDQIGHGHSVQGPEELGHFSKKDSVDILIKDMHNVMEKVKIEYPKIPYFLFGHSFGSFLSRIFAGIYGSELNGLILSGTGNADIKNVKSALKLVRAVRITKKANYRSKLVLKNIFGQFSDKIENPKNMHEWLCRDEESVEEYLNNPLNNYIYTLNGFSTLFYAVLKMQDEEIYECTPKRLPILLMSGSEDPVGEYTKKVLEVYEQYKKHEIEDITIKIYQEARHNILQETNKNEVMKDCLNLILKKL